jgi:glutathionylspermidine synthase
MCLEAVKRVGSSNFLMNRLEIPKEFHDVIHRSIYENHPSIYGRMDLAYDGVNPPKLLEYNADTPTTLIESAVVQWYWMEDKFPDKSADQFNSIHDKLIERWRSLKSFIGDECLYFGASSESLEEYATTEYLRDTCDQAHIFSEFIDMGNIGWNGEYFTDVEENPILYWFKLYPWEWLCREEFGQHIPNIDMGILEPAWKMILSNKGILPILWEMFPNHENLLEASFDTGTMDYNKMKDQWVKKPMLSREGANIQWFEGGRVLHQTPGDYNHGGSIIQKAFQLPKFDDQYAVIGSWVVGDEPAGLIMREDDTPIIIDRSRVVPHIVM